MSENVSPCNLCGEPVLPGEGQDVPPIGTLCGPCLERAIARDKGDPKTPIEIVMGGES